MEKDTLVKVLIAMFVLSMLAGVVGVVALAVTGWFAVQEVQADAQREAAILGLMQAARRVELHELMHGPPADLAAAFEGDPLPTDPWGHGLVYERPGPHGLAWDLVSLGADGAPGGSGADADLRFSTL